MELVDLKYPDTIIDLMTMECQSALEQIPDGTPILSVKTMLCGIIGVAMLTLYILIKPTVKQQNHFI